MLKINAQNYTISEIHDGNKNEKGCLDVFVLNSISGSYVPSEYTLSKQMMAIAPKRLNLTKKWAFFLQI